MTYLNCTLTPAPQLRAPNLAVRTGSTLKVDAVTWDKLKRAGLSEQQAILSKLHVVTIGKTQTSEA